MKSLVCLLVITFCVVEISAENAFKLEDFVIPGIKTLRANGTVCEHIPYMASIRMSSQERKESFGNGHFCGGVFVTNTHVLTLASCLSRSKNLEVDEIEIIAGTRYRYDATEAVTFHASGIIIHPDYDKQSISNNVAVIVVSSFDLLMI